MPISIKGDVKPAYGLGSRFSLKDTPLYIPLGSGDIIYFRDVLGSYLNAVRPRIADTNWYQFHSNGNFSFPNFEQDVARSLSLKFDLDSSRVGAFNELWTFVRNAREYEKQKKEDGTIEADLEQAFEITARLAAGERPSERTFSRVDTATEEKIVIFSDFHMTAFGTSVPDYFGDFNYDLYLDVLDYYAGLQYCLVENGDVEDCLLYLPDLNEAKVRTNAAPKAVGIGELAFPIRQSDSAWDAFMALRYAKRQDSLTKIFAKYDEYYDKVQTQFVVRNTSTRRGYVRLTGNHDTYIDQDRERDLKSRVEDKLGIGIFDALWIKRNGQIAYVVTHGHQYDESCMQHGGIPFAKSLGEVYSECVAWCNQGGDRIWRESDSKRWYVGTTFLNELAGSEPMDYPHDAAGDLVLGNLANIKANSKAFVEALMKKPVAWEYFENSNAFNALTLEVWTGDETFKLRHMDEIKLCEEYEARYMARNTGKAIPTLVIGHTHEPRRRATFSKGSTVHIVDYYLNSGAAGRFENLIWCVEIEGSTDRIVSWSRINGKLTRIAWKSNKSVLEHESKTVVE
jgi:predicted phosphodiesterase